MSQYRDEETRVLQACDAYANGAFSSRQKAADHFGVPYGRVKRRMKGINSRSTRPATNRRLTDFEEKGLILWMKEREQLGVRVGVGELQNEALRVIGRRTLRIDTELPKPLGEHWAKRMIFRRALQTLIEKPKEAARQIAEDPITISNWFTHITQILDELGLDQSPDDIWNYDESGVIIGQGKRRKVIGFDKSLTATAGSNSTRLQVTVGEAVNAAGSFIPPMVILPGEEHQQRWYSQSTVPGNYMIGCTTSGYTNDELNLDWIKHFVYWSSRQQKHKYRALFIDGHKTHMTEEFLGVYSMNDVLPLVFPPHLTHIMQPLDVKVFQPWKSYYKEAVNTAFVRGCDTVDKVDFLNMLHPVRMKALKHTTIIRGFQETGLYPVDAQKVLQHVRAATPEVYDTNDGRSSPLPMLQTPQGPRALRRYIAKYGRDDISNELIQRSALILTTAFESLRRDLKLTNAQKRKQQEARKNARRSLQHCGLLSVDQGRQMVHTLRDKAVKKASNRSEAAKKGAITRALNRAVKLQKAIDEAAAPTVHNEPTTP